MHERKPASYRIVANTDQKTNMDCRTHVPSNNNNTSYYNHKIFQFYFFAAQRQFEAHQHFLVYVCVHVCLCDRNEHKMTVFIVETYSRWVYWVQLARASTWQTINCTVYVHLKVLKRWKIKQIEFVSTMQYDIFKYRHICVYMCVYCICISLCPIHVCKLLFLCLELLIVADNCIDVYLNICTPMHQTCKNVVASKYDIRNM